MNKTFISDYGLLDVVDYCPANSILIYKDCIITSVNFKHDKEFDYFVFYDLKYEKKTFKNVSEVEIGKKIYLFRNEIKDN